MATVRMIEYGEASAEVRALYDEIMAARGIDFVPNVWKTLAVHPPTLRRIWRGLEQVMAPGRLDRLTKELIAIAVSATNGCEYCVWSHTAAARKLGMDDETLAEMMAVVGMFNQTNRLANGFQIEVDDAYRRSSAPEPAKAKAARKGGTRPAKAAAARAKGRTRRS